MPGLRNNVHYAAIVLLSIGAACPAVRVNAASPARPELQRLHALLVIDTRADLGASVLADGRQFRSLLQDNIPRDRLSVTILSGPAVAPERILSHYRGLRVGPNDALLFYYSGHGARDPRRGQFLFLQNGRGGNLLRATLRREMLNKKAALTVLLTDCCDSIMPLAQLRVRTRAIRAPSANARQVLNCLLFRHRGLVDITSSTGDDSFGNEQEGGVFTRAFCKLIHVGIRNLDRDHDGFLSWAEFFPSLQIATQRNFATWRLLQLQDGEAISQATQRPMALHLPSVADASMTALRAVTVRNDLTSQAVAYEFRWSSRDSWQKVRLAPGAVRQHRPPAAASGSSPMQRLELRFGGRQLRASPGVTYRFFNRKRGVHYDPEKIEFEQPLDWESTETVDHRSMRPPQGEFQ